MVDPNFEGSVVLLCAHSEEGSLGLVVNRPMEIPLSRLLPEEKEFQSYADPLFWGGPVGMDRLHVLHGGDADLEDSLAVGPGIGFGGSLEALAEVWKKGKSVRFFLGYSGWDAGQLEAEMEHGVWHVAPALATDVFGPETAHLWQRLVASSDARYSWLKDQPDDPEWN